MTEQPIKLVVFSTDAALVADLRFCFKGSDNISVAVGNGPEISAKDRLDALWMGPMQASYFGVNQVLPPHVGRVFPMPEEKRQLGLPKWLIAGVSLVPGREYTPHFLATICASALATALKDYNSTHPVPILRVGSIPGNLCLESANAKDAIRALKQEFATKSASEGPSQSIRQRQTA